MSNHLLHEKSPYLLQHAQNPVDWYPWSDEAFQKAAVEDKPVFLSIGYSTCHWCHVMAHESFEDEEIARLLNDGFVCVKVDREERPEVDTVYMAVCQAMTGQGGWPLTILMAPDRKPFFAATYLPKRSGRGMTGLAELLTEISRLWKGDRNRLLRRSGEILSAVRANAAETGSADPSWELTERGFEELSILFDSTYGGFGRAPKFPAPHNLLFLLEFSAQQNRRQALLMAEKTLLGMARGGIHDQIGGGFSRYSTDSQWLVPHFEKMLYDNALLTLAYLEGCRLTGREYFKKTAEEILSYVDRELTGSEGGFYCGQDADSEGVEGKYYVFSQKELAQVLKEPGDRDRFFHRFDITEQGNFEGKNIPNLIHTEDFEETDSEMTALCRTVYEYRRKRAPLHRDDKILTSWNSMMISAYAKAGDLFDCDAYIKKAKKAQEFTEKYLVTENGRLLVRFREGESAFPGNLDDYAYNCLALLDLYEVTLDLDYLETAVRRAREMNDLFWDQKDGGFYFYGNDVPRLIERPKELYDGAAPSGNSAAAHVLLTLAALTAEQRWNELANRQISFLAAGAERTPSAHCFALTAVIRILKGEKELICVSAKNQAPPELRIYRKEQKSGRVPILFKCPGNEERLARIAPFTGAYPIPEDGVRYYLCENHTCTVPVTELSTISKKLRSGV